MTKSTAKTYLEKAESVELISEESVQLEGKKDPLLVSKIKLSDGTDVFVDSSALAIKPVVFATDTNVYRRPNVTTVYQRLFHPAHLLSLSKNKPNG